MVKLASIFLTLLLAAASARADLVVVQKIDGGGQSGEQTTKVKGDKSRTDVANILSVIVDRTTGESTTLTHTQRGYVTTSPERNKAMMEKLRAAKPANGPAALVATGKKEKIGDQNCEVFTADLGSMKLTYWLAKDYPNFPALNAQLDVIDSSPLAASRAGIAPRTKDLPGFPMKVQMEYSGEKVTITTLSVREENVDPGIFTIPKGYKELPSGAPPAAP